MAALAALAPFGLNLAVGLEPMFPGPGAMDAQGRAAAVALFALGLGLGQPLAGDAADRFGRRPALLGGLAVALAGALLSAGAASPSMLLVGRVASGLGLAACLVVPRSCLRDLLHGAELQRGMALLSVVFAIAPALTPPLSWLLARPLSWRAPLWMLAILVATATVLSWRVLGESRPADTGRPRWSAWQELARHAQVRRVTLAFAGAAAPFFVAAATGPAALQASTGMSPGSAAFLLGGTYLGFALGNHWVRQRAGLPGERLFGRGLSVVALGMALLLLTLWLPSAWLWAVALTVYAIGHGIVFPAAFALVLHELPQQAGLAAAAIGTVHMCTGGLSAWVAGALPAGPHASLVMVAVGMVALACMAWGPDFSLSSSQKDPT